jgi:hypothetical protein
MLGAEASDRIVACYTSRFARASRSLLHGTIEGPGYVPARGAQPG